MKTPALFFALLLMLAGRADAQQLSLQIQNGFVTLDAQNVTVRQILAEWARVGGARIVNGEKVAGAPVTLQLNRVPERQALDTILRGVSGYMAASRQVPSTGASGFDRILILPTSSAPRGNPPPANNAFQRPTPMPVQAVEPEPVDTEVIEDEEPDEDIDADAGAGDEDGEEVVQPQPGINPRFMRRPNYPNPMAQPGQPLAPQGNFPGAVQPIVEDEDEPQQGQPQPTTPFNVPAGASATPGVIAPAPIPGQQQQQQQGTRPRPPV